MGQLVIPFGGDFESLRRTLVAWGFEVGERPHAPVFAQGQGVTLHAYRTGKILLAGPRAEEWARHLKLEVAPPPADDERTGWVLHFDGLCLPKNPGGVATYGYQVTKDGRVVREGTGLAAPPGPGATNNVAEFTALREGLAWLQANGARHPLVRGDSKLVVDTMLGKMRLKAEHLVPLAAEAKRLLTEIDGRIEWVPREQNKEADRLSEVAYAQAVRAHPEWGYR